MGSFDLLPSEDYDIRVDRALGANLRSTLSSVEARDILRSELTAGRLLFTSSSSRAPRPVSFTEGNVRGWRLPILFNVVPLSVLLISYVHSIGFSFLVLVRLNATSRWSWDATSRRCGGRRSFRLDA